MLHRRQTINEGRRAKAVKLKPVRLLSALCAIALAGCSQIATVSEKPAAAFPVSAGVSATVAEAISRGQKIERTEPLVALEAYISAARESIRELDRQPANLDTRRAYNFAVARIFAVVRNAKLDPWSQAIPVGADKQLALVGKKNSRPEQNPSLYDLIPTDELSYQGSYVKDHATKDGIGAPLVAVRHLTKEEAAAVFAPPVIYYGVTGVAEFEGSRCFLSIHDPLAVEDVQVGGRSYSLAADFTASFALLLAKEKPQKLGLIRLLRPEQYAETARVARLEPYNPNKAVVLVVHGLMDTPATWTPMLNHLRADKDIRRNYQFWFFSYPSGYPYPYSALILRQELDAIEKKYPLRKRMVLIGHSMGGCISRTLITDAGTKLWVEGFGKPPEQTDLPADDKRLLEQALIFKHRSEIGRVIFMSTPHQGSDMASNWLGRFGSMLVKTPGKLLHIGNTIKEATTADPTALQLKRLPNSVDTLAPNNRFVVAINKIPTTPGIPFHSIIGDKGKGDSPNSSDGVVAYWSSHFPGADSELVVPSNHSSPLNPEAIAEVHRILKLNAGYR